MSRIHRTAVRIQVKIQDTDSRITRTEKENIAAMHGKIVKGIANGIDSFLNQNLEERTGRDLE